MRLNLFQVLLAVFLAEQAQAMPISGLPNLPVVGQGSGLINGAATTLQPIPIVGDLISGLAQTSSDGNLLSATGLTGDEGIIGTDGPLGDVVGALQRRQNIPVIGDIIQPASTNLLDAANDIIPLTDGQGVFDSLPLTGLIGDASPISGLLSTLQKREPQPDFLGLGGLLGRVPLVGSLFGSPSSDTTESSSMISPGLLKRDPQLGGLGGGLPSLPSVDGLLPGVGGLTSSLPIVGGGKSHDGILASLPLVGGRTGSGSLGHLPAVGGLTSALPIIGGENSGKDMISSLPIIGGREGSIGLDSIPVVGGLPSSLPIVGGLTGGNGITSSLGGLGNGLTGALPGL